MHYRHYLFFHASVTDSNFLRMSVRVVARVRPLLKSELDKDVIVTVDITEEGRAPNVVKIPSPKNAAEEFTFAFNSVYDQQTSQEELFSAEGACLDLTTARHYH